MFTYDKIKEITELAKEIYPTIDNFPMGTSEFNHELGQISIMRFTTNHQDKSISHNIAIGYRNMNDKVYGQEIVTLGSWKKSVQIDIDVTDDTLNNMVFMLEKIIDGVILPIDKFVIIRGASGAGKSTYVKKHYPYYNHFEADMYWYDDEGNYNFDPTKLPLAHKWCQEETLKSIQDGNKTIVSNTFIKHWEIEPYLEMAKDNNLTPKVIRLDTQFENIHEVPEDVVQRMRDNMESFDGETIIK